MQNIILIDAIVGNNANMPQNGEKKSEQVLINVPPATLKRLSQIRIAEDRPLGYVARELMMRGLALYERDGKLRDEISTSVQSKAKIAAYIGPGEKEEVRRRFQEELVPVHNEGTIGKRTAKRKAK